MHVIVFVLWKLHNKTNKKSYSNLNLNSLFYFYSLSSFIKYESVNKLSVKLTFSTITSLDTSKSIGAKFQIPFTPAFLVNIAAGICKIDTKKYLQDYLVENYQNIIGEIDSFYRINEALCDFFDSNNTKFYSYGLVLSSINSALVCWQHSLCSILLCRNKESKNIPCSIA